MVGEVGQSPSGDGARNRVLHITADSKSVYLPGSM